MVDHPEKSACPRLEEDKVLARSFVLAGLADLVDVVFEFAAAAACISDPSAALVGSWRSLADHSL